MYPEKDVIVKGQLQWSDFESVLHMGEMFIPADLSLLERKKKLREPPRTRPLILRAHDVGYDVRVI